MASRRSVHPAPGDTLVTLSARVMPDNPDGAQQLMAWNLHLALRPFPAGAPGEILPTDIVYVEPPLPS